MLYKRRPAVHRGFSLVEIMIVIAIMGLLASLVTVSVRHSLTRAKQNIARTDISVIGGALDMYWAEYSVFPTNDEGLAALIKPSPKAPEGFLKTHQLADPWGRPYEYICPGRNGSPFEVYSLGGDRREGGEGADADISSDDVVEKQK